MQKSQFFQNAGIRCLLASGFYSISSAKGCKFVSFAAYGFLSINFAAITSINCGKYVITINCGNHSFTFWLGVASVHYNIY